MSLLHPRLRRSRPPRLPVSEPLESRRLLSGGDLDNTFGRDGKVTTDLPGDQFEEGWSVAVQSDQKIVIAGSVRRPGDLYADFIVARYNPDGSPDTAFGGGDGFTTVDFEGRDDVPRDVGLAPGGKIIVAGYSAETVTVGPPGQPPRPGGLDFAVARLNADGSLDAGFDGDGRRRIDVSGQNDEAFDTVVRPNGGVFLVGSANSRVGVVALQPGGAFDGTFDGDGILNNPIPGAVGAVAGELDADGRLLVLANQISSFDTPRYSFVARYLPSGQLDPSFGGGTIGPAAGVARVNAPFALDVTLAPGGKILVGGWFGVARLNSNGAHDTTFAGDGIASGGVNWGVLVQGDGTILGAGSTIPAPGAGQGDPVLVRLRPDGSPDPSFRAPPEQPAGTVRNGRGSIFDVALMADGRSVTVGSSAHDPLAGPDLVLTRRLVSGALDPSFGGGDGEVLAGFPGSGSSSVADVAALPGGKVLALGTHLSGNGSDLALARYNADGSLDTTFGAAGTGWVLADDGGRQDTARALVVQETDGKILVAGTGRRAPGMTTGPLHQLAVYRYDADGRPDATFGDGGRVVIPSIDNQSLDNTPPWYRTNTAMTVQDDGRVVLATTTSSGGVALVRLLPSGAFDPSLGLNGQVITGRGGVVAGVAIAPGGRIVVAATPITGSAWTAYRFNPDGTPDFTFQSISSLAGGGSVSALAIGPGGEVIIGGTLGGASLPPPSMPAPPRDWFVAKYDASGRGDGFFGPGGAAIVNLGGDDVLGDLALLPDGSIVAVGMTRPQNVFETRLTGDFAVVRLNSFGARDTTFGGGDGLVTFDFGGAGDAANAVAVDAEGRVVVGGESYQGGRSTDFALARLDGGPRAAGPTITEVSLGGQAWTEEFREHLRQQGVGGAGGYILASFPPRFSGSFEPLLNWAGIDRVTARLRGPATGLGVEDLRVRGATVGSYEVGDFAYDPATRTATWTLARPVENDKVLVEISTDPDAAPEISFRASVLAGNVDTNTQVNALDLADVKRRLGKSIASPGPALGSGSYLATSDVTADGRINALDVAALKQRLGRQLPAGQPAPAAVAVAVAVELNFAAPVTRELFGSVPLLPA